MPTFKKYKQSSSKSGHYILANVGGQHPVTLQVSELGQQILQHAGYEAEDSVPTKIVWSMFSVGLLYTSRTINDPPDIEENSGDVLLELNLKNKLTVGERKRLLRYLERYTGPDKQAIDSLREEITAQTSSKDESRLSDDVHAGLDRLSRLYQEGELATAEYNLLKSRLLDDEAVSVNTRRPDVEFRAVDVLTEIQLSDLAEMYQDLIPEPDLGPYDSDDSKEILEFDISVLPEEAGVQADFFSAPLSHTFQFAEPDQENRLRKLIDDTSYELVDDRTDRVITVAFNFAQGEVADELTDEDIRREIEHFFFTIVVVYDLTLAEFSSAKISWNHYD